MTSTKHWTTDPDGEVNVKTTLSGRASISPVTVNDRLKQIVDRYPHKEALCVKRHNQWQKWTYRHYYHDITMAAKSLLALGLDCRHGVCILGFNSPEWFIAYFASIMAGGIAAGVYTTNNKEACHYIADNCRAQVFICENNKQLEKILEIKDRLPLLKKVIQYMPTDIEPISDEHRAAGVISWEEFMTLGKELPDYEVTWRMEAQKPGHCAALIYTSGTTGPPKGVMLSHDNLTWSGMIGSLGFGLTEEDSVISFLPLSHIAAQMVDMHAPLSVGMTVWFAQPDALRGSLATTLKEVRPTVFLGVPRVWEKLMSAVQSQTSQATGLKSFILEKSRNIGRKTSQNRLKGGEVAWGFWLANTLVFKNLREKMGLDRCKITCSGAAPLPRSVIDFFFDFDIPIFQCYGMSESTGLECFNTPDRYKLGAAGYAPDGLELKIDSPGPNGAGEICFRGRHVFMGYLGEDDKTRAAIDEDGWLHSGDIGSVDSDGFCFITGRSKEIIITKGGENIAPVPIEEHMIEAMRLVSNVMVVGDDLRYLTMLVTIKCKFDEAGNPTEEVDGIGRLALEQEINSSATTVTQVREDPDVIRYIQAAMDRVNELAPNRASRVQKFAILPCDFSINGGELTPTMKMKRKVIAEKYHDIITMLYEDQ